MINRNVNVHDLSKFDFFNDAIDTAAWLQRVNRGGDAEVLRLAREEYEARRRMTDDRSLQAVRQERVSNVVASDNVYDNVDNRD